MVECWECGEEYEVNIVHPKPERRFCPDCSPMRGKQEEIDRWLESRS